MRRTPVPTRPPSRVADIRGRRAIAPAEGAVEIRQVGEPRFDGNVGNLADRTIADRAAIAAAFPRRRSNT